MMLEWMYVRPDAVLVWRDPVVVRALSWYRDVMLDRRPAKFMVAKLVESPEDPRGLGLEELWRLHGELRKAFLELLEEAVEGRLGIRGEPRPRHSFLDVKAEIAGRMVRRCTLCERRCGVDRAEGGRSICLLDDKAYVHSWFLHMGEEAPLVPSGTIFYGGCNFKCVFCQNWDISQANVRRGVPVSPRRLAEIQAELRERGARNINHVGGEPTPSLHVILESLRYLEVNVPQLWNSNFYMSRESMELLVDVIDIWLPDFKYGNNKCALRLSGAPRYFETVTRNLKIAVENGDMIIRHLVLPGHLECCTKPVLRWIAGNLPLDKVLVNIMDQYRPEHLVARYPDRWPDIARRPRYSEIAEAYRYAEELGINYRQVSR